MPEKKNSFFMPGFVKNFFNKELTKPVGIPRLNIPDQPTKTQAKKNHRMGTPITKTAVYCVSCGVFLTKHKNNWRRISYTCSKICRMFYRGGKDNRRKLKQLYLKRRDVWTERQKVLYRTRIENPKI